MNIIDFLTEDEKKVFMELWDMSTKVNSELGSSLHRIHDDILEMMKKRFSDLIEWDDKMLIMLEEPERDATQLFLTIMFEGVKSMIISPEQKQQITTMIKNLKELMNKNKK